LNIHDFLNLSPDTQKEVLDFACPEQATKACDDCFVGSMYVENIMNYCMIKASEVKKQFTRMQDLRNEGHLFDLCPRCGKRIDWDALVPEPETSLPEKGGD